MRCNGKDYKRKETPQKKVDEKFLSKKKPVRRIERDLVKNHN